MFGLFGKPAPRCDWCGAEIEGSGVADGALRLCSQACAELKNAPPAEPEPEPARTATREMTTERAREELAIALTELEQYGRSAHALHKRTNCEAEFMDSQQSYFQLWERLDAIRNYVATRGGSVADYDSKRAVSLANADRYDIVTVRTYNGDGRRNIGTATFDPGNYVLAAAAARSIQAALHGLSASPR